MEIKELNTYGGACNYKKYITSAVGHKYTNNFNSCNNLIAKIFHSIQ